MVNEEENFFFAEFKKAYRTFLEDEASPDETEIFSFFDKNRNIDTTLEYPSVGTVVGMTVKSLKAAGVDSVEKLYSANNKKYNGESIQDFFNTVKVEPSYTGVGFSILPGVNLSFDEEV